MKSRGFALSPTPLAERAEDRTQGRSEGEGRPLAPAQLSSSLEQQNPPAIDPVPMRRPLTLTLSPEGAGRGDASHAADVPD